MKIGNIIIDRKIFITLLIIFVVVTGLVGYSYLNSDLSSALAINVDDKVCVQENLNDRLRCLSTPDNIKSKYVSSSTGIDFSNISSDTNGKGIYTLSSTIGTTYPVSYYRGAVTDNNVKFGGYCWKIVRTTDTGGTKLIYNGVPDGSGHCSTTGTDTFTSTHTFNDYYNSPAYVGYMYGDVYTTFDNKTLSTDYLYSSSFSFTDSDPNVSGDGEYDITTSATNDITDINNNHYTCWNNTGKCSEISYIHYVKSSDQTAYYIKIRDGLDIEQVKTNMYKNDTDSSVKDYLEDWFDNSIKTYFTSLSQSYNSYLEDTIWCNDRTINTDSSSGTQYVNSGWNTSGYVNRYIRHASLLRAFFQRAPIVTCPQKADSFTVSDTTNGNGKSNYPVGLITADEATFAGSSKNDVVNNYLNVGTPFWTMTPGNYYEKRAAIFYVKADGSVLDNASPEATSIGVRPAISLRHEVVLTGGDGSSTNPYTVDLPFTPSQVSYAKPGSFTTTYDSSTLTMNVDLTTSGGWEYIVKPLSVKKGKNYRISLDYTISNDYTGYSSFSGIGLQVVDSTLSYITTANSGATGSLNEVRITNNRYLSNTAGTYSETIDFTAGEENYFIINCGMAGDDQTINFKISNFYIREI